MSGGSFGFNGRLERLEDRLDEIDRPPEDIILNICYYETIRTANDEVREVRCDDGPEENYIETGCATIGQNRRLHIRKAKSRCDPEELGCRVLIALPKGEAYLSQLESDQLYRQAFDEIMRGEGPLVDAVRQAEGCSIEFNDYLEPLKQLLNEREKGREK